MKTELKPDQWYPEFYLAENGYYGIGVSPELFGRFKIQVLHRGLQSSNANWYVVREYVTYRLGLARLKLAEIRQAFEQVPNEVDGAHWREVADRLPICESKYLEDFLEE